MDTFDGNKGMNLHSEEFFYYQFEDCHTCYRCRKNWHCMAFNVSDYLPCQLRKKIKKSVRLQTSVCWYLFTQIPIVKDSLVLTKTKLNLSHIFPQKPQGI